MPRLRDFRDADAVWLRAPLLRGARFPPSECCARAGSGGSNGAGDRHRRSAVGRSPPSRGSSASGGCRRALWGALHHPVVHQLLEVVVERAGAKLVLAFRLSGDLLHDAVSMPILGGERKQDVQSGRGQGEERTRIVVCASAHGRILLYRIPSDMSRGFGVFGVLRWIGTFSYNRRVEIDLAQLREMHTRLPTDMALVMV